jgi:hypothetical protein
VGSESIRIESALQSGVFTPKAGTQKPQQTQNAAENDYERLAFVTVSFSGVLVAAHKAACVAGASPVAGIGCEPA